MLSRKLVSVDSGTGAVRMTYFAPAEFANRHGTVHGGLQAAMLDSATSKALYAQLPPELTALTMQLTTTFVRPAPLGDLTATAWVTNRDDREAHVKAELYDPAGVVVAHATARLRIRKRAM